MEKIRTQLKDEKYKDFSFRVESKQEEEEVAPMRKYQSVMVPKKTTHQYVPSKEKKNNDDKDNNDKVRLVTRFTLEVPVEIRPRGMSLESKLLNTRQWNPPKKSVQIDGIYLDINLYNLIKKINVYYYVYE